MSLPVRLAFALSADAAEARPAFDEIADEVRNRSALILEPLFVPSYAALSKALETGACDVAWAPPIVAHGILATGGGKPLVAVGRGGRTSYYAVLLARAGTTGVGAEALSRAHVGWVSKLSASGYTVPSLYLRSLGLEPDELFGRQSFLGSHEHVLRALEKGDIDVGATYASLGRRGRTLVLPESAPRGARVVTAAGPIPGDVIFVASRVSVTAREALRGALLAVTVREDGPLARMMNVDRFEVPALAHFETLRRWRARAAQSEAPPDVRGSVAESAPV
jgi:ABC-type phosphate/phosphonate transport system substrate-binding protein